MKVLICDDEQHAVSKIERTVIKLHPEYSVVTFTNPINALAYVTANHVDIAFLDMEMPEMHGIELGKAIKEVDPETHLVFVTAYDKYALNAIKLRAGGYLLKPAREDDIKAELEFAYENQAFLSKKMIRIQCFGGFEVFDADGERIVFPRAKSKELLAYLVDKKGASATTPEIAAALCEDRAYDDATQSMIRKYASDMISALKAHGADDIVFRSRNSTAVNIDKFECDYYNYLKGDAHAINMYKGDYMIDYSWAEFTNGSLQDF